MAATNFSGPVVSANGFDGAVQLPTYTSTTLPSAANAGTLLYVSNVGSGIVVVANGTTWVSTVDGTTTYAPA